MSETAKRHIPRQRARRLAKQPARGLREAETSNLHVQGRADTHRAPVTKRGRPIIGRNYTGRHALFMDTVEGVYWEALPSIAGSMYDVQTTILRTARSAKQSAPAARIASAVQQIARRCAERIYCWLRVQPRSLRLPMAKPRR
jgi:hypothetical protein